MYKQVKDQQAWQLEHGQELNALKEKVDAAQETGVTNRVLDNQTALRLATLDRRVEVLERQGRFLLDRQEQDSNTWHNIMYNLREEVEEAKREMAIVKDLLNVQRRSNQQLCTSFNKARQEMVAALKVACQERRWRQMMRRELDELKEEFAKLKGMVRTAVATVNIQNDGFPTAHIIDIFSTVNIYGPQMEKGVSSDEEVPQENVMAIPVPSPSMGVPQTLWEIPPSPSPSCQAFLSEPVVIVSSIPPLGSSPQLLRLLVEDSSVGVGMTVEEFEEAVECEAKMDAMVEALVELEEEPLTNDLDAVGELLEVWDTVVDTSPVEGDFEDRYNGGGIM